MRSLRRPLTHSGSSGPHRHPPTSRVPPCASAGPISVVPGPLLLLQRFAAQDRVFAVLERLESKSTQAAAYEELQHLIKVHSSAAVCFKVCPNRYGTCDTDEHQQHLINRQRRVTLIMPLSNQHIQSCFPAGFEDQCAVHAAASSGHHHRKHDRVVTRARSARGRAVLPARALRGMARHAGAPSAAQAAGAADPRAA